MRKLLFGIELNDVARVTKLNESQIGADLRAIREAGADGLVCSWDLRHMSIERLELVRSVWFGN